MEIHEIAAAKFAVDRQVEERPVSQSMLPIDHEADLPNFLGFQRLLGPGFFPAFHAGPCSTGWYDECPIIVLRWPGLACGRTNPLWGLLAVSGPSAFGQSRY